MGKKISVDSATLVNKVFEILECYRLFDIPKSKFKIIIHPQSFIHSIVFLKSGISFALMHKPDMKIPISILLGVNNFSKQKIFSIKDKFLPNTLEFEVVDKKRFPIITILSHFTKKTSLFESSFVSANDSLVEQFLKKKISFNEISKNLLKLLKRKEFNYLKNIAPRDTSHIKEVQKLTKLKTING